MRVRLLLLVAAAATASCGNPTEAALKKHRPAAQARLDAILKIPTLLTTERVPTGAPFALSGPEPRFGEGGNAIVMEQGHFDWRSPSSGGFHLSTDNPIADACALLGRGELADGRYGKVETKADLLRRFGELRYVLVIRGLYVKEPVIRSTGAKLVPASTDPTQPSKPQRVDGTFEVGSCEGDLLLIDLDPVKSVGGWHFETRNNPEIRTDPSNPKAGLLEDLRIRTRRSIDEEFRRRYPSAPPPFERK